LCYVSSSVAILVRQLSTMAIHILTKTAARAVKSNSFVQSSRLRHSSSCTNLVHAQCMGILDHSQASWVLLCNASHVKAQDQRGCKHDPDAEVSIVLCLRHAPIQVPKVAHLQAGKLMRSYLAAAWMQAPTLLASSISASAHEPGCEKLDLAI